MFLPWLLFDLFPLLVFALWVLVLFFFLREFDYGRQAFFGVSKCDADMVDVSIATVVDSYASGQSSS